MAARTALCLDFDGTLAPIVDDPETAAPLPGTPELLDLADLTVEGPEGLRALPERWAGGEELR